MVGMVKRSFNRKGHSVDLFVKEVGNWSELYQFIKYDFENYHGHGKK